MHRLRLLGGVALDGPDGPVTGAAVQRHRLALLAVLVTAPGRSVPRQVAMTMLWPDRDERRARNVLNQAVFALRRELGEEAVETAGGDLRIGGAVDLRSDVEAFDAARSAGDLTSVVGLYAGPFMEGFFLPGSPSFEQWQDRERSRREVAFREALEVLAGQAAGEGDPMAAVGWWRRRVATEPHNARVVVRLMEALDRIGDRAGALQLADAHAAIVRDEFDALPHPSVTDLADRLRVEPAPVPTAKTGDRERAAREPPSSDGPTDGSSTDGDGAGARSAAGAGPGSLGGRRRRAAGVALAATLGVAAVLTWCAGPGRRTGLDPDRVVVAPSSARDTTSVPGLDVLAAHAVTREMGETGVGSVVPATVALEVLAEGPGVGNGASALAEVTGAGTVVIVSSRRVAREVRLYAEIADGGTGTLVRALEPVVIEPSDPMAGVEVFVDRTLGALGLHLDAGLAARRSDPPPSYEGYLALVRGHEAGARGAQDEALDHYRRAAALHPDWIHPRWAMISRMGVRGIDAADTLLDAVLARRDELGPFDQARLDLTEALLRGDGQDRYATARRVAEMEGPGSPQWVQVGVEALRLNRPGEARRVLSALRPEVRGIGATAAYWRTLADAHHLSEDHRAELEVARRARTTVPAEPAYLWLEARALAAMGRLEAAGRKVEDYLSATGSSPRDGTGPVGDQLVTLAMDLGRHGHTEAADGMFERGILWYRSLHPVPDSTGWRSGLGWLLVEAHRDEEARTVLAPVARDHPRIDGSTDVVALNAHPLMAVLAARAGREDEATAVAEWLYAADVVPALQARLRATEAPIHAALGDTARAVARLREAFEQGYPHGFLTHVHDFEGLRGHPAVEAMLRPRG